MNFIIIALVIEEELLPVDDHGGVVRRRAGHAADLRHGLT